MTQTLWRGDQIFQRGPFSRKNWAAFIFYIYHGYIANFAYILDSLRM